MAELMISAHDQILADLSLLPGDIFYRPSSIRLTYKGYLALRKIYSSHKFDIKPLSNKDLINLYQLHEYPYYLGKTYIVLFSKEDAFALSLIGDISSWLSNSIG